MKYLLVLLFLAASSAQKLEGSHENKDATMLIKEAEIMVEKFMGIIIKDGQRLMKKLQWMEQKGLSTNTTECKQLEAALNQFNSTVQNMTVDALQTELRIKQEILNIETQCSKNGTISGIAQCIVQRMGPVIQEIKGLKPTIVKDLEIFEGLSKTAGEDFVSCLRSQRGTTPKPQVTTSQLPTST